MLKLKHMIVSSVLSYSKIDERDFFPHIFPRSFLSRLFKKWTSQLKVVKPNEFRDS